MRNHVLSTGAAAVLLFLAACGGDAGTSGSAEQTQQKALGATTETQSPSTPDLLEQELASVAAQTAGQTDADGSVYRTKAAVEAGSISAELLASMLLTDTDLAGGMFALLASGPYARASIIPAPVMPALRGNQRVWRESPLSGRYVVRNEIAGDGGTDALRQFSYSGGRFNELTLSLPIWVNVNPNSSSRPPFSLDELSNKPAGTELMRLLADGNLSMGRRVYKDWQSEADPAAGGAEAAVKSSTGAPFTLRIGDRIPLNTVVHRWTGDNGAQLDLLVIKGSRASELRQCFDIRIAETRRLSCTVWAVPANWSFADGLHRGHVESTYIVDDRRAYPNQSGLRYWMTPNGSAKEGARVPVGPTSLPTRQAIGTAGISADVLAAMLAHDTSALNFGAQPASGPIGRGKPIAPDGRPDIQAGFVSIGGMQMFGAPRHYGLQTRQDGGPPAYRDLELVFGMTPYQQVEGHFDGIRFDTSKPIARHTPLLNLTHNARLSWTSADGREMKLMFHPTRPFAARKDNLLVFDRVLQRWVAQGGHKIELFVLKGEAANQAQLCVDVQIPAVKRTTCTNWAIPAGWSFGQPLVAQGISVADDRSVSPTGGSGQWFWQSAGVTP